MTFREFRQGFDFGDLVVLLGLGLVSVGAALFNLSAGLIVLGAGLLLLGGRVLAIPSPAAESDPLEELSEGE